MNYNFKSIFYYLYHKFQYKLIIIGELDWRDDKI